MKILLTNSPLQYFHVHRFLFPDHADRTLAQLATMVGDYNEVKIVDNWTDYFLFKTNNIIPVVEKFKPDIIGISNTTYTDTGSILKIVSRIRKLMPDVIIVGGGQTATMRYKYLLLKGFDFVVPGEGEFTFQELIQMLNRGERDFSRIRGLAFKCNGEIVKTGDRALASNLDLIPIPSKEYLRKMRSFMFPGRYAVAVETSRGCLGGCEFCSVHSFWRRTYRKKSNTAIIEELKGIQEDVGPAHIYFVDDSFCLEVKEYSELFRMIINERIDIRWWTHMRPDIIVNNPEMIALARKSGMFGALIGFETYDQNVLRKAGKELNVTDYERASQILKQNGIIVFGMHMLGMPGQTSRDFKKTYRYGRNICDFIWTSFFFPLPGTKTFERYRKEGKIRMADSHYRSHSYEFNFVDQNIVEMAKAYEYHRLRRYLHPGTFLNMIFSRNRLLFKIRYCGYRAVFIGLFLRVLTKAGLRRD